MTPKREPLITTFKAKDGTDVIIRPVVEMDAYDIITAVQTILINGSYIQKEQTRTLEEEKAFIKQMQADGSMYTAVEIDGSVVGIARVVRGELEMKRHCGVFRTWLVQAAQGKGIGTKLMEYTLNWGRQARLYKIWLTVFSGNSLASKLYEHFAFEVEGTQKNQVLINGEYQDEIYMAYFFS